MRSDFSFNPYNRSSWPNRTSFYYGDLQQSIDHHLISNTGPDFHAIAISSDNHLLATSN